MNTQNQTSNLYNPAAVVADMVEHGHFNQESAQEIFEAFEYCFGEGYVDDWETIADAYQGQHDSEKAFAEQLDECEMLVNEMPENLRFYFDYEAFARDLFIDSYVMSETRHVFNRNW